MSTNSSIASKSTPVRFRITLPPGQAPIARTVLVSDEHVGNEVEFLRLFGTLLPRGYCYDVKAGWIVYWRGEKRKQKSGNVLNTLDKAWQANERAIVCASSLKMEDDANGSEDLDMTAVEPRPGRGKENAKQSQARCGRPPKPPGGGQAATPDPHSMEIDQLQFRTFTPPSTPKSTKRQQSVTMPAAVSNNPCKAEDGTKALIRRRGSSGNQQ